jgi:hypothetical protein
LEVISMRRTIIIGVGLGLASGACAAAVATYRRWGIDPAEATRALPGDDLVPEPTGATTRALVIDAPPGAIWPWLAQMGYGRGGWYSYDAMDMKGKSATTIDPKWQGLAVGDIVPTDPKGGFEALVVDPSHALVMYTDTATVDRQRGTDWRLPAGPTVTPGLRFSGAMMQTTPREFKVSWALILDPIGEGRTRLIERVRVRYEGAVGPGARFMGSLLGFGVFVMVRRQMLNLKRLAEGRRAGLSTEVSSAPKEGQGGAIDGPILETLASSGTA